MITVVARVASLVNLRYWRESWATLGLAVAHASKTYFNHSPTDRSVFEALPPVII